MVTTPLKSQQQQEHESPNPTDPQEISSPLRPPQQPPEPPHSETLETPDPPNPQSDDQETRNPDKSGKKEETLLVLEEKDQKSHQETDHQTGTTSFSSVDPIILSDGAKTPPAPALVSPINTQRRPGKRKKVAARYINKRKKSMKKVKTLTDILNPIPFSPTKSLDFDKFEEVLKRLGLWDFSKIEFDRNIRTDLVSQLIANYDSKKRCSYVSDFRINVNRADLARALKLPPTKPEKGSSNNVEEVDLDSELFSDDAIVFIEDFVSNWILLHNDKWTMPTEITNWTRCIRDGHPEKMDSASLIWYMVDKELNQGDKLTDCYYASHLQYLIKSQREEVFVPETEDVEEVKEEDDGVVADCDGGVTGDGDGGVAGDGDVKADEEKEESVFAVWGRNIELNLGPKVEEEVHEEVTKEDETVVEAEEFKVMRHEEVTKEAHEDVAKEAHEEVTKEAHEEVTEEAHEEVTKETHEEVTKEDETMVEAEESKEVDEDEPGGWLLDRKRELGGEHFLQRCSDLNGYEGRKPEEVEEDEQVQQMEEEEEEEEEGGEGEEAGERVEEGFDMDANNDSLERDGLTDNFLQGMESSHIPFGSQGELRGMSSTDLFGARDVSFMGHGGPSFFGNGGKRAMEPEEDINHLDSNNKRLKTEDIWTQKPTDFGVCMEQMQHWMEKAKMIYESKDQSYANSQFNQQITFNQLQERHNILEMIIKSKDEELEKKQAEAYRLERELYLMGDLLAGYRKALNDTRLKFSEYKKQYALPEEPLYKHVGPGGLVLSTRELEKQRIKQEEDRVKFITMAKDLEERCTCQFEMHRDKVSMMAHKLVCIENEVKRVKELYAERKEVPKGEDEVELPAQPEENAEPRDEPAANDASAETVPPDAAETQEADGGDE